MSDSPAEMPDGPLGPPHVPASGDIPTISIQVHNPGVFMVMGPGRYLHASDVAQLSVFDITPIERAVAIARLESFAQMLKDGF